MTVASPPPLEPTVPATPARAEAARLRDLSPAQWKSGVAAWLGWMFDGLDMHLYTLVAAPFVAHLLGVGQKDPSVGWYSSVIQAAFLVGWALGGAFFGRIADRIGRSRALVLTILTYAAFTGLSFFATTWWQLGAFRFLAALGIGGEWAVGAALLSETWPKTWRPWIAAVLQTGVNFGVILAGVTLYLMADLPSRYVFLVGVLPAFIVLWIRRAVPEPEEWHQARLKVKAQPRSAFEVILSTGTEGPDRERSAAAAAAASATAAGAAPGIAELFHGPARRITVLVTVVCACALTAHWAFLFWCPQHLRNLPGVAAWSEAKRNEFVSEAMWLVIGVSIAGNFLAAVIAKFLGFRRSIAVLSVAYCAAMLGTYAVPRDHRELMYWLPLIGLCHGVFALFTMYLPPLFPTLLRTTGAGFSYNIGRIVAAAGTVFFGLFSKVGDHRQALFYAAFLFVPAAAVALLLPDLREGSDGTPPGRAIVPSAQP